MGRREGEGHGTSRPRVASGVHDRWRGASEIWDCEVASRLAVSVMCRAGAGEIQMPSWSHIRLVGTKCWRSEATKDFNRELQGLQVRRSGCGGHYWEEFEGRRRSRDVEKGAFAAWVRWRKWRTSKVQVSEVPWLCLEAPSQAWPLSLQVHSFRFLNPRPGRRQQITREPPSQKHGFPTQETATRQYPISYFILYHVLVYHTEFL